MTNHPNRSLKIVGTKNLTIPSQFSRVWSWTTIVAKGDRTFEVQSRSMLGAYQEDYETAARSHVASFLEGKRLPAWLVSEVSH